MLIVYATFVKTVYGGVIIFCYCLGSHSSPLPIVFGIFVGEWNTLVFMDFDHGVCSILKSILCVLNIFRVFFQVRVRSRAFRRLWNHLEHQEKLC